MSCCAKLIATCLVHATRLDPTSENACRHGMLAMFMHASAVGTWLGALVTLFFSAVCAAAAPAPSVEESCSTLQDKRQLCP